MKLKNIKLFESFQSDYSVVAVYLENQMAVGVLDTEEAESIFSKIRTLIGPDSETQSVEIVDIPENHDLVVFPFGGVGTSTTTLSEYENYNGLPPQDIVELGKDYNWDQEENQAVFKAPWGIDGFVLVDSAGGTHLIPKEKITGYIL